MPYAQQPPPGPGPWGHPPMAPPPRHSTGKVLGILGAVAVVLVVAAVAGYQVFSRSSGGFPEAKYRMSVPGELLDGTYKLTQDLSDTSGKAIVDENRSRANVRDPKAVVGQYAGQGQRAGSALVVSGMYGRFKNSASARDDMMRGAAEAQGATVAVPARDITPAGSGITVRCQVLTSDQGGARSNVPLCAWGDDNTGATVGVVTAEDASKDPSDIDLDEVARTTLEVREEMREPIR
ncbi:hypothetical protein [Streptomyces sp. A1499]|uniref:hypothetical protein n=1 Tax=Streptomyces sp. A1499 TaxID=2563104 RepID=UPI001F0F8E0B|nr:hypothetical protein [Streptomyces sp. A1499]